METIVWDLKSQFETYKDTAVFDCMLAEFLLSEGRSLPTQEVALLNYGVTTLEQLAEKQKAKLSQLPAVNTLLSTIELPLIPVLYEMEKTGISLAVKRLQSVGKEIEAEIMSTEEGLKKTMGSEINLNSSVQVGTFLAEKSGVPLAKTKTGRYATNETELTKHAESYPIIKQLLTHRELTKLRSTYVDSLITKVDEHSRIHTTYSQVAASTGRLSSSNPNLQNIPVTSHFGQLIKACFTATPDHVLISFDYSQQELRILAHLTGEEKLIDAFKQKRDVHNTTASQLFKVDYDKVTREQRLVAKTVNFGIIYGMSSYGMSAGMQMSVEAAQKFIDTFYTTYPKIKTFYDNYLNQGKLNGYVETLLGRRRYVFEKPGAKFIDNAMRRVLMNYPIQGAAADIMKKAMVQIHKEILTRDHSIRLLLQIHDDLVFEVENNQKKIDELVRQISDIMCTVYPLSVPNEVDVKISRNWGR